jgi:phospholipase/carboxylesterase
MEDPRPIPFGPLDALAFSPNKPQWLVVLCHGYGASGTDLAGLAEAIVDDAPSLTERAEFVFPAAPIDMAEFGMPGGRAWWPINMQRLLQITQSGSLLELVDETPPGLIEAAAQLDAGIKSRLEALGLGEDRLILGGFSQGAMVTTHLAFTGAIHPRLLVVMSGALICRPEWTKSLDAAGDTAAQLAVFQSHGKYDPVLPFVGAQMLGQLIESKGIPLDFWAFGGEHGVPAQIIQKLAKRIEQLDQETSDGK